MSHGWWCRTKTFPMTCKHCQQRVFFYSCDCGSRVFFETLGPPWRTHSCYPGEDLYAPSRPNTSFVPRRERLARVPSTKGPFIAHGLVRRATASPVDHPIRRIDPEPSRRATIVGEVREVLEESNVYKALRYSDAPMGRAILGKLASGPMGKVTVHAPPETRGHHIRESYTAWVPAQRVRGSEVVRGAAVEAELEAVVVPDRAGVWFCRRLEVL